MELSIIIKTIKKIFSPNKENKLKDSSLVTKTINPFRDDGQRVSGKNLIGRTVYFRRIEERLFGEGRESANISIQGIGRIGKTSIACHLLMDKKKELFLEKNIVVLFIDLSTSLPTKGARAFYHKLLYEIKDTCEYLNIKNTNLDKIREKILDEIIKELPVYKITADIQSYLIRFSNTYKIILIIDELDAAIKIFKGQERGNIFQSVREWSSTRKLFTLVTTSRRPIAEIEIQVTGISTFAGTFAVERVNVFTEQETSLFLEKFVDNNITINKELQDVIYYYSGSHPFLLQKICYQIFNHIERKKNHIETIHNFINKQEFINYFKRLILFLEELRLYKLYQSLIFGPILISKDFGIGKDRLLHFGVLKVDYDKTGAEIYQAFSPFFEDYLRLQYRNINIWDIWSQFELEMRWLLFKFIHLKFEGDIYMFCAEDKDLIKIVKYLEKNRRREINDYGDFLASKNLFDQTAPVHLWIFVDRGWDDFFKDIFYTPSYDFEYWEEVFIFLKNKVRNPFAHNKIHLIGEEEKRLADRYCKEIIGKIDNWKKSNGYKS